MVLFELEFISFHFSITGISWIRNKHEANIIFIPIKWLSSSFITYSYSKSESKCVWSISRLIWGRIETQLPSEWLEWCFVSNRMSSLVSWSSSIVGASFSNGNERHTVFFFVPLPIWSRVCNRKDWFWYVNFQYGVDSTSILGYTHVTYDASTLTL